MTENRGFASMDKEDVRAIASKGGRASSGHTEGVDSDRDRAEYQPPSNIDLDEDANTYSSPAHNTRSQTTIDDDQGPPVSQTATEDDEIVTYGGRQGFASMKERDPERQREIASMGGNAEVVDAKDE
ncbi:hypothetical protein PhCBS80983_g04245 [Powellomyces hirtus]|uniref:Uncharacterized protein n=1 Tax=Powellomyces hirtus TaxID=109895 RepID=A0A507DYU5_9FUNG|nr:hypothetical protein DFJ77DRAFT_511769 [Powellomyces hirtus]TPX56814.1 hypothetical protein PhCBS80983_g04245 [Powellomyces hirtus]